MIVIREAQFKWMQRRIIEDRIKQDSKEITKDLKEFISAKYDIDTEYVCVLNEKYTELLLTKLYKIFKQEA